MNGAPKENKSFGEYCIAGAHAGKAYGSKNGRKCTNKKINDFVWLKEKFNDIQLIKSLYYVLDNPILIKIALVVN